MTKPLGVILAGGAATRMGGGDKGRLMVHGQSLFERVIGNLKPQVSGLLLNANGDAGRFSDLSLPIVADSYDTLAGPLSGVLAGLEYAADHGFDQIVTVAADTPFFPHNLVDQLVQAQGAKGLALAASRDDAGKLWRHPTFGLWPAALRADLRMALNGGLRKVVLWTDQHDAGLAEFPNQPFDPFFNINTPEDLQRAEAFL